MRTEHKTFFEELGYLLKKYNAEIDAYEEYGSPRIEISFDYDQEHAVRFTDNIDFLDCSKLCK
jgi:hypothetical protein